MRYSGIIFLVCFTLLSLESFSQDSLAAYKQYVHQADSLFQCKQYAAAAQTFHLAFNSFGGKGFPDDRYNAARAWALAGNSDSAFYNLWRITTKVHYDKYFELKNEPDLVNLHTDLRWRPLLDSVKGNELSSYANTNAQLSEIIDSLIEAEQRCRHNLGRYWNQKENSDTALEHQLMREVTQADKNNYPIVDSLFRQYGFPGYNLVGVNGANNFWALVQHQDRHPEFQDCVLEKMKIEVDKNNANKSDYAYLVDRVKGNLGQWQVYGTQMHLNKDSTSYEPNPCIDPDELNERRKGMGLRTIEEYTQTMNEHYHGTLCKHK